MGFFKKAFKVTHPFLDSEGPDYGKEAAKAENERQERIRQGTADVNTTFAGFTPTFYDDRAKAYTNFALPQLAGQYQTTRNQLLQNLASRGLLKSSSASKQGSTLEKTARAAGQTISETGRAQAQDLERQVEDRRNSILGLLYQSADPASARSSAVTTAASFRQPSAFAPLVNVFSNLANQYYSSALLDATRQGAPTYNDYDWGSVNPGAVPGGSTSRRV